MASWQTFFATAGYVLTYVVAPILFDYFGVRETILLLAPIFLSFLGPIMVIKESSSLDVVGESAVHLSKALAWVIAMLDPDIVVFGHPGDVLGESLLVPLREALTASGIKAGRMPRLVGAKLSAKLDDVAALMAVIDRFRNRD